MADPQPQDILREQIIDLVFRDGASNPEYLADQILNLLDTHTKAQDGMGGKTCVCELAEPCMGQCTCARPFMSGGCLRCATYGNPAQRLNSAKRISAPKPDTKALVEQLEGLKRKLDVDEPDDEVFSETVGWNEALDTAITIIKEGKIK